MSFDVQYESFPPASAELVSYIDEDNEDEDDELFRSAPKEQERLWIPDSIVISCYACEETFSFFRRRHHCRVCGHVFCHPCSNFYIDGECRRDEPLHIIERMKP
jgi:FYVE zinc finger